MVFLAFQHYSKGGTIRIISRMGSSVPFFSWNKKDRVFIFFVRIALREMINPNYQSTILYPTVDFNKVLQRFTHLVPLLCYPKQSFAQGGLPSGAW